MGIIKTYNASWGRFIELTTYKAESAGREVRLVNPRPKNVQVAAKQ